MPIYSHNDMITKDARVMSYAMRLLNEAAEECEDKSIEGFENKHNVLYSVSASLTNLIQSLVESGEGTSS